MKRNLLVFSDTDNWTIKPFSNRDFRRILKDFGNGTKLVMTLENYQRTRSLGQNNLLHWYSSIIAKEIGEDRHALKQELKSRYGVWEERLDRNGEPLVDEETGEILMKLKSTSRYTKEEMSELIDGTLRLATKLGIVLPDPEDAKNNNHKI